MRHELADRLVTALLFAGALTALSADALANGWSLPRVGRAS